MPIILLRHGATEKNLKGGGDTPATPLALDGKVQAAEIRREFLKFCAARRIRRIWLATSGYVRTEQTARIALAGFARHGISLIEHVKDPRIGEIKFLPREFRPTPENPGLFGRCLEGETRDEVVERFLAFDRERLQRAIPDDTLALVVGHRSGNRVLTMAHTGHSVEWLETLPKKNNCELWKLDNTRMTVIHPGFETARDRERRLEEGDTRRRSHIATHGIYRLELSESAKLGM